MRLLPDVRQYLTEISGLPYPVDEFVAYALHQLELNRGIIVAPAMTRLRIFLLRLFPGVVDRLSQRA